MNSVELIKELCSVYAPSGYESRMAELVKNLVYDVCPEPFCDTMGNVIIPMHFGDMNARERKRIMVCAHMDEVGFMINEIRQDGTLGFDTIGGISESVMSGRRVTVMTRSGDISGVIASKAIHHKDKKERETPPKLEKLYIDIGAADADEARECVRIGDTAVFDSEFYEFGEGLIKARALDDRMGCAAMVEMIHSLAKAPPSTDTDVYFCFTTREEIGLSGAKAATLEVRPQIAIILETTAVADIADVDESRRVAKLSDGVAISVMDRSTIYDKELIELALSTAKEHGISAQIKKYVSGGNDAGTVHKTGEGTRTLALSVPTRYLHSPACVASLSDYTSQKQLCEAMIRKDI